MIDVDDAPASLFGVKNAELGLLAGELLHIPHNLAHRQAVLSAGGEGHLAIDHELNCGGVLVVSSGDEEGDVRELDFEGLGGQGAGGFVAVVGRTDVVSICIVLHISIHALRAGGGGGFSEGGSFDGPLAVTIGLKGIVEDFRGRKGKNKGRKKSR